MKIRTSLFGKFVLWFVLSVVVLLATYLVLFRVQLRINPDSPLRGPVGERLSDVAWKLAGEVGRLDKSEWSSRIASYSQEHGVTFHLVDRFGNSLLEADSSIPEEVVKRIADSVPPHERRGPPPGASSREQGRVPFPPGPSDTEVRGEMASPQFSFETNNPTRYWMGIRTAVLRPDDPRPKPIIVLAESDTLFGSGLFWDPFPWIVGVLGFLAISLLLWLPMTKHLVGVIGRITKATERMAHGEFDIKLEENRSDELGRLSRSINHMARRLDGYITGQKRFLGDIAHELASPIARLQMALGILEHHASPEDEKRVKRALEEVGNLSDLVNELLSFTRAEVSGKQMELETTWIREVVNTAAAREGKGEVEFTIGVADDLTALAVPELLARALSNILRNAVRYAGTSGPIEIVSRVEGEKVFLEVMDSGPGVPEEELGNLFKPFFRAAASRSRDTGGVGLGLAIVETCVQACRGSVTARNREGRGFVVTLVLKKG